MLCPHRVRLRGTVNHAVRILNVGIALPVRWHEVGPHAVRAVLPVDSAIGRAPGAAARDRDRYLTVSAGIDTDGVNAGVIGAAAEPLFAFRTVPQRAHELPRVATVCGAEQPARNRAAPQRAEAAALQRPDTQHLLRDHPPTHRLAPFFFA